MTKYFTNFFHIAIIAGILLSINGCGYKGDPVYTNKDTKIEKKQ